VIEIPSPKVVNAHHFGGSESLPPGTIYIGRPSIYGNAYSSASGKYTKEECIALHRMDLYHALIKDPSYFSRLRTDLEGRDLACWCKQSKRMVGCHGDTYLHIFDPRFIDRDYTRSIVFYQMDDIRKAFQKLENAIRFQLPQERYLMIFIRFHDARIDFIEAVRLCRKNEADGPTLWFFLSAVAIDLELAAMDTDPAMIDYRIEHAMWRIYWYLKGWDNRDKEPSSPYVKIKKS
jgi:hypothetical protein